MPTGRVAHRCNTEEVKEQSKRAEERAALTRRLAAQFHDEQRVRQYAVAETAATHQRHESARKAATRRGSVSQLHCLSGYFSCFWHFLLPASMIPYVSNVRLAF